MAENDGETAEVHDFLFWLAPLPYDQYHADYLSRRHPGTLEVFLSSARYTDWVQEELGVTRPTLLFGEPGVGKTILISVIIDDLMKRFSEKADVGIAYLYCTRQHRGVQKTSDLCLGITAQLSAQCLIKKRSRMAGGLPDEVDHLYRMNNWSRIRPTRKEVWQSFKSAVSIFQKTFIIVDGIDELEEKSRREFLKTLRTLMRISVGTRILISSRFRDGIVEIFEGEKEGISTAEIWAQQADLVTYIDGELDRFPQFLHDDQHLRMELKQKVMAVSSGSFLRAHLYMQSFDRSTYESLQGSLLMLPATPTLQYEETVATLMQNNENGQDSVMALAKQVLKWLVFSKRQLTFSELQYALAIDSECPQFNLEKLPAMENIPNSGGLVHINYASRTVRTHRSQIEDCLRQMVERWCPGAEREIAQACLAFLSLSAFDTGPCKKDAECEERKAKWPLLEYAALYWSQHAQDAKSSFPQAVELLQNEQKREAAWQIMRTVQVYPLRQDKDNKWSEKYSKDANALHVAAYCGVSSVFHDLLEGEDVRIVQRDSYGFTPLAWAACGGHQDIMKLLMNNTDLDLDTRDYGGRTPMSLAAENGHEKVVQLLLESGANPRLKDLKKATPLWYATVEGHASVLRHLLSCEGVDINIKVKMGRDDDDVHSPLSISAVKGYTEVVSLLLGDARIDPHVKDKKGHSPLWLAVQNQHEETVKVILDKVGIHPELDTRGADSVLYTAAEQDSEEIVQMLLGREEINLKEDPKLGGSALSRAVQLGHEGIVRLLLDKDGMDISSATWSDGRTVLHITAFKGNATLTRLLLEKGIDPNAQDDKGRTPLYLAAEDAHEDMVEVLVSTPGIELELKDTESRTALSWAIDQKWPRNMYADYKSTIQILIAAGCDPDSKDSKGRTPLSYAASAGKLTLVELLLGCRTVEPDSQDEDGWTPLLWAVAHGHEKVVETLLKLTNIDANVRGRRYPYSCGETPLCLAAAHGHLAIVNLLFSRPNIDLEGKDGKGRNALMQAAINGHAEVVRRILELDVFDLNSKDDNDLDILSAAAVEGHSEVVKVLVGSKGIKVDAMNGDSRTPLSLAAEMGHRGVVEQLLKVSGIDPNSQDRNGRTPLSWAVGPGDCYSRRLEDAVHVTELLLWNKDIKINLADNRGWTPLSWAVQQHEGDAIVDLLLATPGVDVNYKDREGLTPLSLAKGKSCKLAVKQLQCVPGIHIESIEPKTVANRKYSEQATEDESTINEEETQNQFDLTDYSGDSCEGEPGEAERHHLRDELRKKMHLPLVSQQPADEQSDSELCKRCETFDLDKFFSWRPQNGSGDLVAKLGRVDETWESRTCAMCRLIAAIRPRTALGDNVDHELRSFSSTDAWLCQDMLQCHQHFQSSWIDTVFLAVVDPSYDRFWGKFHDVLRSGFIARVGSNCRNGLRALTVPRMKPDQIDFSAVRSWIDCCIDTHFNKRCKPKPNTLFFVPHLELIDCANRKVITPSPYTQKRYVALSYVWGPYKRAELDDSDRLGKVESVVEDAMHVTLQLGFTYLWVDRHCINQNDEAIMKEQLHTMDMLYRNAELTIIAAAGSNSSFGLPGVRGQSRVAQPCSKIKGHILTSIPPDPDTNITTSKWHTRGWTYQEGLLSRRRLIFTEHEVSFECNKLLAREAIALPMRIYRMSARISPTRLHPGSWSFPRSGIGSSRSSISDWFTRLQEYTSRSLKYEYDALNAMLGIFHAYEELVPPVYQLCGVPMLTGDYHSYSEKPATSLEGFTNGLCWYLTHPAARRPGFPSWSWAGWKGVVGAYGRYNIHRSMGFAIYISIILGSGSLVPWDVFERFQPWERKPLQQYHVLEITGAVIELSIHQTKNYSGKDEWEASLYHGDEISKAHVYLDRTPYDDVEFSKRLLSERWLGLLIGNSSSHDGSTHLLVLDQKKSPCERIAYAKTFFTRLVDEEFERRTFRLG